MSNNMLSAVLVVAWVLVIASVASASGGADYKGQTFFVESFKDTNFASRGWYDLRAGAVLTTENVAPGTTQVFECRYAKGGTKCADGYPMRIEIPQTEEVYLSYWVRYSPNWVGSGRGYHPHEFHFSTNIDTKWVSPANSHLTMYIEQVGLVPRIALQDSKNVDPKCVRQNGGNWQGCNGNSQTYEFTEARSVAACNGLEGLVDISDCYWAGSYWYSARAWSAPKKPAFTLGEWHFVEVFLRMNDIVDGSGVANGSIRYWLDGESLISSDNILFRTGQYPKMAFKYFMMLPWIGDGSPVEQYMWVGDITVAKGVMP